MTCHVFMFDIMSYVCVCGIMTCHMFMSCIYVCDVMAYHVSVCDTVACHMFMYVT